MQSRTLASVLVATFAFITTYAIAADDTNLETGLVAALSLKKGTTERIGDSGKAIQAYIRAGLINKKPNQRADYTDYYLLKKPASFMGHELVVIEEEYMARYVGCCVSPGAGVSLKLTGSAKNLEDFAQLNKCTLKKDVNLQKELQDVSIKATLRPGSYANLSCRERDADR